MPRPIRTTSKPRLLERTGVLEDEDKRAEIEDRLLEHPDISIRSRDPGVAALEKWTTFPLTIRL